MEQLEQYEPMAEQGTKKKRRWKWPKRILKFLLCLAVIVAAFLAGRMSLFYGGDVNYARVISKLQVMEQYVEGFYLWDVSAEDLEEGIYAGFMEALGDEYSTYYTKEEYDSLMEEDSGEYEGIGVTVYKPTSSDYVYIEQVNKDQPAYNAGILAGDYLKSVDGTETDAITLQETVSLIKDKEKDKVELVLLRDGEEITVTVEKANIEITSVEYEMKENNIGYISVSQFIENTDEAFIAAVDDLESQGMESLIIDLRDNGGGLLDTCVNMASRIIPEGDTVVSIKYKDGEEIKETSNSAETLDIPIVILVNENSASASEVFTGCLKDYGKATVVGEKTFGKGIVQNIIPLSDGSGIKVTTSDYYTPNGVNVHKVGIEPDVTVELTDEEELALRTDSTEDTQLEKAIDVLEE